jgi:hypothetical protein
MQLIIKVDLDKAKLSLPEIFKLVAECSERDEVREEPQFGWEGLIRDSRSHVIGEWTVEDEERELPNPLESPYRAAAIARYGRPGRSRSIALHLSVRQRTAHSLRDGSSFLTRQLTLSPARRCRPGSPRSPSLPRRKMVEGLDK